MSDFKGRWEGGSRRRNRAILRHRTITYFIVPYHDLPARISGKGSAQNRANLYAKRFRVDACWIGAGIDRYEDELEFPRWTSIHASSSPRRPAAAPRGSRARTHGTTISQPTWPGVPDRLHPAHAGRAPGQQPFEILEALVGYVATELNANPRRIARYDEKHENEGSNPGRPLSGRSSNGTRMYAKGLRPGAATPPQAQRLGPVARAGAP